MKVYLSRPTSLVISAKLIRSSKIFFKLTARDFPSIQFLVWSVQTWGGDSKYKKVIWKSSWDISDSAVGSGPQVGKSIIKVTTDFNEFEALRKVAKGLKCEILRRRNGLDQVLKVLDHSVHFLMLKSPHIKIGAFQTIFFSFLAKSLHFEVSSEFLQFVFAVLLSFDFAPRLAFAVLQL